MRPTISMVVCLAKNAQCKSQVSETVLIGLVNDLHFTVFSQLCVNATYSEHTMLR